MRDTFLSRIDPAGHGTATVFAVVSVLTVSTAVALNPRIGLILAAALVVTAIAVGLHLHGILSPLWPLVVVGVFMPLNGLRPLEFVTIGDIMLMFLGLISLVVLRRARPPLHVMIVLLGTLLVTAGGIFGMMATQDWAGVSEMAKFVLGAPMVIVIIMLIDPSKQVATLLLTAYATGAVISTYSGMFQAVDPAFGRASGLGVHVGHLALAAQLGFFVWAGWFLTVKTLLMKVVTFFLTAMCLYGVLLSGTRTALFGLGIGAIVLALSLGRKGAIALGGSSVFAVFAYFFVVPYLPNSDNIYRALGQEEQSVQSDAAHTEAFIEALRAIGQHPWTGWGFGEGQLAHNLVLQIANLGGLVGLVGFLVIWIPIGLMFFQRVRRGVDRDSAMATATFCGVLAYFIFAQFQPLIWDRHLWFFIVLTLYLQHPFNEPWPTRDQKQKEEKEHDGVLESV